MPIRCQRLWRSLKIQIILRMWPFQLVSRPLRILLAVLRVEVKMIRMERCSLFGDNRLDFYRVFRYKAFLID
jgi:hypothetical protein